MKKDRPVHYFLAAGGCLVVAALCVTLHLQGQPTTSSNMKQPRQSSAANIATPVEVNEAAPSSEQKTAHTVPADHPRYLDISKLGLSEVRVHAVGLDTNGHIAVPTNIHDAAWYKTSAKPGQTGTTFIDGHLSGPNEPGVFAELKELTTGDDIIIETGAGETVTYTVEKVEQLPVDQVDMEEALQYKSDEQSLTLMTCGGHFDRAKNVYEDRVIVYATVQQ